MELPDWYGKKYPTISDLEAYAEQLGAVVIWTSARFACYRAEDDDESPAIFIPKDSGPLEISWRLAHELGHLTLHTGPKTPLGHRQGEARASRWAACALIPEARIKAHSNASEDSMIAALSCHFEDLPFRPTPQRKLAKQIASIRLSCLEAKCVNE